VIFGENGETAGLGMLGVDNTMKNLSALTHATNLRSLLMSTVHDLLHPWLPPVTASLDKSVTETMNLLQRIYT